MRERAAIALGCALMLAGCKSLTPQIGPPVPETSNAADSSVVLLPRLVTELKCDYQDWRKVQDPRQDRMIVDHARGTLTLSLVRDTSGSGDVKLAIPVAAGVALGPNGKATREAKRTVSVEIPIYLGDQPPSSVVVDAPTPNLDCGGLDRKDRLPEPILPLLALGQGLSRSPAGKPYFVLNGDLHITGQFYFKSDTGGGFSIAFVGNGLGLNADRLSEYVQSYDICVVVTGNRRDIDAGKCAVKDKP